MFLSHIKPRKCSYQREEIQATPDTMIGDRWYCLDDVEVVVLINLDIGILLLGRLSLLMPAQCMNSRLLHPSGVLKPHVLDDPKGSPKGMHLCSQARHT